jgi:putative CRISPR-associated protein (TIGR02619 family)
MKTVITTVGTSVLTNYQRLEVRNLFGDEYDSIDDDIYDLDPQQDADAFDAGAFSEPTLQVYCQHIREVIESKWLKGVQWNDGLRCWTRVDEKVSNVYVSAEISTLVKIQRQWGNIEKVVFLCTDTLLSVLSAEIMRESPTLDEIEIDIVPVKQLDVKNFKRFKEQGLGHLVDAVINIVDNTPIEDVVMNITGGYKALIPFLTLLAQIKKIPVFYLYEESSQLLQLPQLPINFDWGYVEAFLKVSKKLKSRELPFPVDNVDDDNTFMPFCDNGLLVKNHEGYNVTEVGELYASFAAAYTKSQKDVKKWVRKSHDSTLNGYFAEYKWFEYYHHQPLTRKVFHGLEKTSVILNGNSYTIDANELDLVVEQECDFMVCECKTYTQFMKKDEMPDVIAKRLYIAQSASAFHCCVLATKLTKRENMLIREEVMHWAKELFAVFEDSGVNFRLFIMFAPPVLQTFMQSPVSEKDVFQLI